MGLYKLMLFTSASLNIAAVAPHTLAATQSWSAPPRALNEQSTLEQPALEQSALEQSTAPSKTQLQSLILPLIHYPDHLVSAAFAASANPEQIALAATYLKAPSRATPTPTFDQPTLTLMQYPALLRYMAANLVWVSELSQALAAQGNEGLWAALEEERFAPTTAGEPIRVTRVKQHWVYRSRPVPAHRHRSAVFHEVRHHPSHRVTQFRVKPRHAHLPPHRSIWRDSGFYDLGSRRHERHRSITHRAHYPNHRPGQWRLGLSYGHHPRLFPHSRGFNDDWLFAHQRKLERRIHPKHHGYRHRDYAGKQRREHTRDRGWDRRNGHKQERQYRHEHRQEHRQERRQEHRKEHRQQPREHDAAHRRSTPRREPPRPWMSAQGPLR